MTTEGRPDCSRRPSLLRGVYRVTWEEEGSRALEDDTVTRWHGDTVTR